MVLIAVSTFQSCNNDSNAKPDYQVTVTDQKWEIVEIFTTDNMKKENKKMMQYGIPTLNTKVISEQTSLGIQVNDLTIKIEETQPKKQHTWPKEQWENYPWLEEISSLPIEKIIQ